jgi:type VI secretion system secreted protein Hcp
MKNIFLLLTMFLALLGCLFVNTASAQDNPVIGNINIEGSKQGTFKGDGKGSSSESLPLIGFTVGLQNGKDASSGLATGKKQYSPITIIRYSDAATPTIFQAMATNEALKTVTIQLVKKSADGKAAVFETIKLANATIVKFTQCEGSGTPVRYVMNNAPVEEIEIDFQSIQIQVNEGKTTAKDNWLAE